MNASVLQEKLLTALVGTGRIVVPRPQLPVMQYVLLEATTEGLWCTTTSTEVTERRFVAAKIEKEGATCVSSRLLTELTLSFPQGPVRLAAREGALEIQCAGYRATLPSAPATEFPPVPKKNKKGEVSLPKDELLRALSLVLFAAATDDGRPILTGVSVRRDADRLVLAATDGYRLSLKRLKTDLTTDVSHVIPSRALAEVVKVGEGEKEEETIGLSAADAGQLVFTVGDTEVFTRPIDGDYPNVEKIIPATHTTRILLDRGAILRAVKSAAIVARDNANIVRFHIEGQTITVSANTPQVGENQVEVEAKVDGEGGDIAFNSRFLLEFLTNITEDELLFEMTGSLNPGAFKPVRQTADDSYLHIIMPVRVQT